MLSFKYFKYWYHLISILAVPKDSDMAQNLLKQEEAQRLEKEKMKKLTLEINERQEEEDLNEAIAMVCCACAVLFYTLRSKRGVIHRSVGGVGSGQVRSSYF